MAQADTEARPIEAAILYERDPFAEPLREALAAAGAHLVAEYRISEMTPERLAEISAAVLLVNLEPLLTAKADLLDALFAGVFAGAIVFNDAEATEQLHGSDRARWARHLASKIHGGTGLPPAPSQAPEAGPSTVVDRDPDLDFELWLLGASIGGPEAVRAFLGALQDNLPFAFILAQHIGEEFIDLMAGQLNQVSPIPVRCAEEGDVIEAGQVLIVPVTSRLTIGAEHNVELEPLEKVPYSPCIDQVMIDAAERYPKATNAIIFSGMSTDGVAGARRVLDCGGEVWVQDPETCVVSSIVEGALETGRVSFTGHPLHLAERLNQRAEALGASATSGSGRIGE